MRRVARPAKAPPTMPTTTPAPAPLATEPTKARKGFARAASIAACGGREDPHESWSPHYATVYAHAGADRCATRDWFSLPPQAVTQAEPGRLARTCRPVSFHLRVPFGFRAFVRSSSCDILFPLSSFCLSPPPHGRPSRLSFPRRADGSSQMLQLARIAAVLSCLKMAVSDFGFAPSPACHGARVSGACARSSCRRSEQLSCLRPQFMALRASADTAAAAALIERCAISRSVPASEVVAALELLERSPIRTAAAADLSGQHELIFSSAIANFPIVQGYMPNKEVITFDLDARQLTLLIATLPFLPEMVSCTRTHVCTLTLTAQAHTQIHTYTGRDGKRVEV